MKRKKLICGILSAVLALPCMLSGCKSGKEAKTSADGDSKLSYWCILNPALSQTMSNFGETPLAKELNKRLGVEVTYIHPPLGQETEKFNLLVASNEMPDIIWWKWGDNYTGGPSKAIREKRIISLNEYKEHAPNFIKYLSRHREAEKLSKTDDGDYFGFTFIKDNEISLITDGPLLRKDWLDELKLDVPETIDDWENVLRAFKEKKGASAPVSTDTYGLAMFSNGFNTTSPLNGYYQEDGVVKTGFYEDGFKKYVTRLNKWYEEGLLDRDFATLDMTTINSNILSGVSGATYNSIGSGIGRYMAAAEEPGYSLVGAPYPVEKSGDERKFTTISAIVPGGYAAAITTSCKNIPLAMKFLDYGYSDEGHMLMNFGVEGKSYELKDGYPTYTKLVTNNDKGLAFAEVLGRYTLASSSGPIVQDHRYMEQYAQLPEQKEALKNWSDRTALKYVYPPISPKSEDLGEYSRLRTDIDSYAKEMFSKFVVGVEPIKNYDKFVSELKAKGMDRLLEIMQEALNAYNAR